MVNRDDPGYKFSLRSDAEEMLRSLAKWVGMPGDAPLLDITVEASAALEALASADVHEVELLRAEKAALTAVIEQAKAEARASSVPLGMPEATFYRQTLRRVESTLETGTPAW